MQPYVVILAGNHTEAYKYARRIGLPAGRFRIASSASSIRGLRYADIHTLPSFHKRLDRHAVLGALKFTKGERIDAEMPPKVEEPAVDQGDGMGQQLTIEEAIEAASTPEGVASLLEQEAEAAELAEEEHGEETGETEQGEDPAPAEEESKRTRRRRCPDCGVLVPDLDAHQCEEASAPLEGMF